MTDKTKNTDQEVEKIQNETEKLQIDQNKTTTPQFKVVKYCAVCTFPEEFCEYSHELLRKRKELPVNVDTPTTTNAQPQTQTAAENQAQNKEGEEKKAEPAKVEEEKKEQKEKKHKKITDKIHIKNTKRSKRKAVTVIKNIEKFGLDMKEVSKMLSKKFACSSSVSKDEENKDSIVMTGEFEDDLKDFLMEKFKTLKEENFHIDRIKKKEPEQGGGENEDD
jgi:density-regulated protein DRP1